MSTIKLIDQFRASSALHAAALNKIASMDDATLAHALARVDDATLDRALARVDDATLDRVLARVDDATLDRVLARVDDATLDRALARVDDATLDRVLARVDDATLDRVLARVDDATLDRVLARVDDATLAHALARVDMPVPVVADLDARMLAAAESGNLDMGKWHCGTTHCRAGWAVVFGGDDGARLEQVIGTEMAGRLIYEASTGRIAPNFYASNDAALADIRACAALAAS